MFNLPGHDRAPDLVDFPNVRNGARSRLPLHFRWAVSRLAVPRGAFWFVQELALHVLIVISVVATVELTAFGFHGFEERCVC